MRCHSLSTWGFEDTAGMSSILSSEASSFDSSSSQSHRAIRPSWTESAKTIISNDKCVTALTAIAAYVKHFNLPIRCTCIVLFKYYLKTKSVAVMHFVKIQFHYSWNLKLVFQKVCSGPHTTSEECLVTTAQQGNSISCTKEFQNMKRHLELQRRRQQNICGICLHCLHLLPQCLWPH